MTLTRTHKVTLQTETEVDYAEALRAAYGAKDFSDLVRYLIRKSAEEKTLVKNHLEKIKKAATEGEHA